MTLHLRHIGIPFYVLTWSLHVSAQLAPVGKCLPREPKAWDTCYVVEWKDSDCTSGERPRAFRDFLVPTIWMSGPQDGFSAELHWDLTQRGHVPVKAVWNEVGLLGVQRIRHVTYWVGNSRVADLILAEGSRGVFSPLMKWNGEMPDAIIHKPGGNQVLVLSRDYGGNVPSVATWAWVGSPNGPILLNVNNAVHEAIQKVAPGHIGYASGVDWQTLHYRTWTWPESAYPGKIGVNETVDAWFELKGTRLAVKKVDFRSSTEEKHWP